MGNIDELLIESDKSIEHQEMDSKEILRKIKEKPTKSKYISPIFMPIFSALFVVALCSIIIPLSIPKKKEVPKVEYISSTTDNMNIIGLASINIFKNSISYNSPIMKFKKDDIETNDISGYTKYLFKEIKIMDAKKISLGNLSYDSNFTFINEKCGMNNIEIIICNFQVMWSDLDTYDNHTLTAATIVGDDGFYTIMLNGGGRDSNGFQYDFSSHIVFNGYSVDKSSDGPFYGILVNDGYKEENFISFGKNDNFYVSYNDYKDNKKYVYGEDDVKVVSREIIYNLLDIDKYGVTTLDFEIVELNYLKGIIVKNESQEYKIIFADNTNIYKKNGEKIYYRELNEKLLADINIIEVTFSIFNGDIPKIIYPISIIIDL